MPALFQKTLMLLVLGAAALGQAAPPTPQSEPGAPPGVYKPGSAETDTSALARVKADPRLASFVKLIEATQQESLLRSESITVLAPTNDAIRALPKEVGETLSDATAIEKVRKFVRNHVVIGAYASDKLSDPKKTSTLRTFAGRSLAVTQKDKRTLIADARVVQADIPCANGVVHIVDHAMLIPTRDLLDVIKANPRATTFLKMLQKTGLDAKLQEQQPFTMIVPTDEAWGRLSPDFMKDLMDPAKLDELIKVIHRHMFPGTVRTANMRNFKELPSKAGDKAQLSVENGVVVFNRTAHVVEGDLEASNGMVHLVDDILRWVPTGENAPKTIPPPPPGFDGKPGEKK